MKSHIRKKVLETRKALVQSDIEEKSRRIFHRLLAMDVFRQAEYVMAYIDFRNEVSTLPIIHYCLNHDKKVILPITIKSTKQLLLSELKDPAVELQPGAYGIPEPSPKFIRPFSPQNLNLILVPAVAFDPRGSRLGYGGGYYDRFLSGLAGQVPLLGLAFELQIIERIPSEPTDIPVDCIVTEDRIIDCIRERMHPSF